ncbi:DUF2470 domain-containing protein [Streptomyces sp. MST-110588]|uniref:DUF2470 domain-containing protein n=1 Tax=Streptomyces sp. MST-110588 TaxID=2833628 RepID=UPI001F5C56CF|nr:DUF2470 domain-containing protein [Streptomyces sp. MST-110588]
MASLSIPGVEVPDESALAAPVCRTVTPEGDVLLLVPGDCAAARAAVHAQDDDLAAVMEITDVAPVSVPHRVRGRAWIAGWLTPVRNEERARAAMLLAERHPVGELLGIGEALQPDPAPGMYGRAAWVMLRLEVGEASVDDLWGVQSVEPEEFADALPDPLVAHEAELLQHLDAAHGAQVRGLCSLLGDRSRRLCGAREGLDAVTVTPVALDRFGLRVRFTDAARNSFDARFEFPEPVRDVAELRRAMHTLFEAAQ